MKIIPTIFAHNKREFDLRFKKLIRLGRDLQIDFMDGRFVKSHGIKINDIPNLSKYKRKFEAHLMVKNPGRYILPLRKKGFNKIIFHYEALKNNVEISELIKRIKDAGMEAWIAINPQTQINDILVFLNQIDGVLLMGVYPGKEHQEFIPSIYNKIKILRNIDKKIKIQVDGGVNLINIGKLRGLGVNYVNSGSFISDAEEPKKVLKELGEQELTIDI